MVLDTYRGTGLALALSSAVLSAFSYLSLGLSPITALWVGVLVVGLSMFSTPTEEGAKLSEFASTMLANLLENIGRTIEGLSIRSRAVYRASGDSVYIIFTDGFSRVDLDKVSTDSFISRIGDTKVLVLKSPIARVHTEGLGDVCSSFEEVVVDRLNLAESIECVDRNREVIAKVVKPKLLPSKTLERTTGNICSILLASIAALLKGGEWTVLEKCELDQCLVRVGVFERYG